MRIPQLAEIKITQLMDVSGDCFLYDEKENKSQNKVPAQPKAPKKETA